MRKGICPPSAHTEFYALTWWGKLGVLKISLSSVSFDIRHVQYGYESMYWACYVPAVCIAVRYAMMYLEEPTDALDDEFI